MTKFNNILFLITFMLLSSLGFASKFTVMTFNVENLFDNLDDPQKEDETYLPSSMKTSKIHIDQCNKIEVFKWRDDCLNMDWNDEVIEYKLNILAETILSYEKHGPDVIGFQEVENENILKQLFNKLKNHGYKFYALVEGNDDRGIDNAFISKYKILNSKLHQIEFTGGSKDQIGDTRPILESVFMIKDKEVSIYNVHFPAPYNPLFMRKDAFATLDKLASNNEKIAIALGDFNVTSAENAKEKLYENIHKTWFVSHLDQCAECKGTNYYYRDDRWSFLDAIMLKRESSAKFVENSVEIIKVDAQTRDDGSPIRFNSKGLYGVSDHFPVVVKINIY
tara:strand:+ start:4277 stop:5284 length:1008 start_codon:yes stop_codon:yes gene_type:complete